MNDDTIHHKRMLTTENPPKNTQIESLGAAGSKLPEIRPVKQLSFVPMKSVKAVDNNAEYSDVIHTDDEIREAFRNIDTSYQEVLATMEKLAAERQKTLELAFKKPRNCGLRNEISIKLKLSNLKRNVQMKKKFTKVIFRFIVNICKNL